MENPWEIKIKNSQKYYQQWETRFRCRNLEEYWEGCHHKLLNNMIGTRPYVVNLIMAEINRKLGNILHKRIQYVADPTPASYEWDPIKAMESATLKEDTVNTIVSRRNMRFNTHVKLCAQDSYFRFGVGEVGYAADWQNPASKIPLSNQHDSVETIEPSKIQIQDSQLLPENERVFFHRIKPSRFRVSVSDDPLLENCSFCGYYSYFYNSTLKNLLGSKFENANTGLVSSEFVNLDVYSKTDTASADAKDMREALQKGQASIVWRIWDNEDSKKKLILLPDYKVVWEDNFERLPFITHRHNLRFDGWYPIPPVYHWTSPQDEINEAREQMRRYRRRSARKYSHYNIDTEEIEKLQSDDDGVSIKKKGMNSSVEIIPNPQVDSNMVEGLTASKDDFITVVGSSSNLDSIQTDRTTATQSKITANRAALVENIEQLDFGEFYTDIAHEIVLVVGERFVNPLMVGGSAMGQMQFMGAANASIPPVYKMLNPSDLNDGYDCKFSFEVLEASPLRMEEEFNKYIKFLATLRQFPEIMLSPIMIMETAYRCGYRNKKVIGEMMRTALLSMLGQTAMAAGAVGTDINGAAKEMQGLNANNTAMGQGAIDTNVMSET